MGNERNPMTGEVPLSRIRRRRLGSPCLSSYDDISQEAPSVRYAGLGIPANGGIPAATGPSSDLVWCVLAPALLIFFFVGPLQRAYTPAPWMFLGRYYLAGGEHILGVVHRVPSRWPPLPANACGEVVIVFICLHLVDLILQNDNIQVTHSSNIAHNLIDFKMPPKYDIWAHQAKIVDFGEVLPIQPAEIRLKQTFMRVL